MPPSPGLYPRSEPESLPESGIFREPTPRRDGTDDVQPSRRRDPVRESEEDRSNRQLPRAYGHVSSTPLLRLKAVAGLQNVIGVLRAQTW